MKTPETFVNEFIGKADDYDGAYGVQCVDAFRRFGQWAGIPVGPTPDNWAQGYWLYRDSLGYSRHFEYITDHSQVQNGDWCIWLRGSSCSLSHIAMYYNGKYFGQRQDGKLFYCLANIPDDWAGALRWKEWSGKKMKIEAGKLYDLQISGQRALIYGQPERTKIGLLSAKQPGKDYSQSVQTIGEIDSPKALIYAKMNANYFIMGNGQHLGVRVGIGEEWEIPRQNAFWYYAETKKPTADGIMTDVGMDFQWPYDRGQVQMACSPAIINYRKGKAVSYESPAAAGTKAKPTTQSVLIRTTERYAFCVVIGQITPEAFRSWAVSNIANLQDLCFMDSGGSSCLQVGYTVYYATAEKRPIADALIFYEDIEDAPDDDPADNWQTLYEALKAEYEALDEKHTTMITAAKEALEKAENGLIEASEVLNG